MSALVLPPHRRHRTQAAPQGVGSATLTGMIKSHVAGKTFKRHSRYTLGGMENANLLYQQNQIRLMSAHCEQITRHSGGVFNLL